MHELIQAKVDGEELVTATPQEEPQILNLMEALKASVADAQQTAKPAKKKMSGGDKKKAAKRKSG
jgi:non-homologous end joining protein Ku